MVDAIILVNSHTKRFHLFRNLNTQKTPNTVVELKGYLYIHFLYTFQKFASHVMALGYTIVLRPGSFFNYYALKTFVELTKQFLLLTCRWFVVT